MKQKLLLFSIIFILNLILLGSISLASVRFGEIENIINKTKYVDNAFDNNIIHHYADIFIIVYEGYANDGFIRTVDISGSGIINNVFIDELEFDEANGVTPEIIKVSDEIYAVVYEGTASDGFLKTINVSDNGTIVGVVDTLEFDEANGVTPEIIKVSDEIYAVVYEGATSDGFLKTINVSDNGTIVGVVDTLEFDEVDAQNIDIINITDGLYAIIYTGTTDVGTIKTIQIFSNGSIGDNIDTFTTSTILNADIDHVIDDVYIVAYQENGYGNISTYEILTNGSITGKLDTLTTNITTTKNPDILKLYNNLSFNLFVIAYADNIDDGYLRTFTVENDGSINPIIDEFLYDGITGINPDMVDLNGTVIVGYLQSLDNYLATINITIFPIDDEPPIITLILPANNTINNTFPLNITFNVVDDSTNDTTCILSNNTYDFDERTFAQGNNYLTLQVGNLTEISQKFPNLNLSCYDNTELNNSAAMLLNYTIDKVLPQITIFSPTNRTKYNNDVATSINIHAECYDDNIYNFNITIQNSSDIIVTYEDNTPVSGILSIDENLNIVSLGDGNYTIIHTCADQHNKLTRKNKIDDYTITKNKNFNQIKWTTLTGNEFELRCDTDEGILSYGSYKSDDEQTYIFYYNVNGSEGEERTLNCELENRKFDVDYIQNSQYIAHFIMENNWIDFELCDKDAEYDVSLNQNNNYEIEITTTLSNIVFNSVGELNIYIIETQFEIEFIEQIEDFFQVTECDNATGSVMMLGLFVLIALSIIMIGFIFKIGFVGVFGSILLIIISWHLAACISIFAYILALLSVVLMIYFVVTGLGFVSNTFK